MLLAYVLFALGSPAVKFLVTKGGQFGLAHPHAISFCNVLFVGNVCAALLIALFFGGPTILKTLFTLPSKTKVMLLGSVVLATIYPALLFDALETTTVTNLVLLSRFEAVLYGIAAAFIFKLGLSRQQIAGYVVIAAGILLLVLVGNDFQLNKGDKLVLLAGLFFTAEVLLAKRILLTCPPQALTFCRVLGSAFLFFWIAMKLFGPQHFMEAFEGELWAVMTAYALVIVVLANLLYYKALPDCNPDFLTKLALLSPVLTILFAYALLGERPGITQSLAGLVILAGMAVANWNISTDTPPMENAFAATRTSANPLAR